MNARIVLVGIGSYALLRLVKSSDLCRLYDERRPLEPTYPSLKASIADPWIPKSAYVNGNGQVNGNKPEEEWTTDDDLRFAPPG